MLNNSRALAWQLRIAVGAVMGVLAVTLFAAPASADEYDSEGFESFALGQPLGQFGWTAYDIPIYNASLFDNGIVDPSAVWGTQLGTRALRISNAVTSFGFGNQLQSPSLVDEAGETAALNGGLSGGTRQSRFAGSFVFASATQASQSPFAMGVSADKGDGTRMAHFVISDSGSGLDVTYWYSTSPSAFAAEVIATGLSYTEPHTIEWSLDLVDGPNNDVMWIRIGDSVCNTWIESGSWENVHTVSGTDPTPATWTMDSLLFRVSGTPNLANAGNGFLFDDVTFTSSTVAPMPPVGVPGAPAAPTVELNGGTVTVVVPPVVTNGCAPVTEYTVTLTPTAGGTPITVTSPTPNFSFPSPPAGTYDVTVSAANSEGTGSESPPRSLTIVLAESGPGPATWPLAGLAAALALVGSGLVFAGRRGGLAFAGRRASRN